MRVALQEVVDLIQMFPAEYVGVHDAGSNEDAVTLSVARGDKTTASLRVPIDFVGLFADAMHGGCWAVANAYNAQLNLSRITTLIVEHRRDGGDVGELLGASLRAFRNGGPAGDRLRRAGSHLDALAAHLPLDTHPDDERVGQLAQRLRSYRTREVEDRLGRALRAAAGELGGVDAVVGDSPAATYVRRFMEDTVIRHSGHIHDEPEPWN